MQFPWSAVVGQDTLKHALILCAIDPAIGGVLVHGPRGVAKTTLARALAELVPGAFVELPLGASEERVIGTLNLERAMLDGRVEFAPGLLARAHEGVLYVDEVNLLPDALVDVLLDAAATGRNVVERDGVSHTHPARFVLIGSMNPEEGELRPQLIDRFGLSASAQGSIPPAERAEIVMRRLEFDRDPERFRAVFALQQAELVERCRRARERACTIPLSGPALVRVTERCHAAGVEGVRADLAMLRAARAHAAWNDRVEISLEDVAAVAELALAHRVSSGPGGEPQAGGGRGGAAAGGGGRGDSGSGAREAAGSAAAGSGARRVELGEGRSSRAASAERRQVSSGAPDAAAGGDGAASGDSSRAGEEASRDGEHSGRSRGDEGGSGSGALPARPVRAIAVPELPSWMRGARGRWAGKHRRGKPQLRAASGQRGRATRASGAIDWFATLREHCASSVAAESAEVSRLSVESVRATAREADEVVASATLQVVRGASTSRTSGERSAGRREANPLDLAGRRRLRAEQLRFRERRRPASQLWIVAVDCSSSMLRGGGLAVAKGVAHALELSSRRAGARLAVISFRGAGARLEVDSSPGRAVIPRAIAALGGGGGTPLRDALAAAHALCRQTRWRAPGLFKRLLLLTDGRVSQPRNLTVLPPDLDRVVIDCERGRVRLGRARQLSAAVRGKYWQPPA